MTSTPNITHSIHTPRCHNLQELPSAASEHSRLCALLSQQDAVIQKENQLSKHLLHGLAYTTGSALGSDPPTREQCLSAFVAVSNKSQLTAGARAWSKHAHRSFADPQAGADKCRGDNVAGWWGKQPTGPVAGINEKALHLSEKAMDNATWRNLHWLPHQVLVYEVRVEEGYGMRWSQDRGRILAGAGGKEGTAPGSQEPPWVFRGFVEPMMENGHGIGWRH
ncbi:hypothetical protein F5I97DRAFT_1798515 [Phlebopus sp. FC_14]|nr:hypothetical protein F5I97DRAFT_1798515 [Phlebopus sp. FC_14]